MTQSIKTSFQWLEDTKKLGSKLGLESIKKLLKKLENPQRDYKVIHITGTNGKGSTSALVQSILTSAGYRVGLFISPYLHSFTESITINGKQIGKHRVSRIIEKIRTLIEEKENTIVRHPTHFELLTAIAFKYFQEESVDYAVVEVGMGGQKDATNVADGDVSIITNISLEHTKFLGETELEIAEKKAGIIKQGTILVTAVEQPQIIQWFKKICRERRCRMIHVGTDIKAKRISTNLKGQVFTVETDSRQFRELFIPLLGRHQLKNAMCAIAAAASMDPNLSEENIRKGVALVKWPGRLEVINQNPLVLLDGAKEVRAVEAIVDTLLHDLKYHNLISVVSISSDKNIKCMIKALSEVTDKFILTEHRISHRVISSQRLAEQVDRLRKPYCVINDVEEALRTALNIASMEDLVLITGSIFLIGQARELITPLLSKSSDKTS